MRAPAALDGVDARLVAALQEDPRATVVALAEQLGISRNTVQSRLARLEAEVLDGFERRVPTAALGFPLQAHITARVTQRLLTEVADELARIPEVLEVVGVSGPVDLLILAVARDADDLYRVAGRILATPGVERTETALTMRPLVPYRVSPLLAGLAGGGRRGRR